MTSKVQVTIDVIVHATEDISKIFESFEVLGIQKEDFVINESRGHFENPIIMLNVKVVKKQAQETIYKILEGLPAQQVTDLIEQIKERTINSSFHMRLDKQELVKGRITVNDQGSIKLKIFAPIYNKKDTVRIFTEILSIAN